MEPSSCSAAMFAFRCICFSVELWAITVYECAFCHIQDRAKQRPQGSLWTYLAPWFPWSKGCKPLADAVLSFCLWKRFNRLSDAFAKSTSTTFPDGILNWCQISRQPPYFTDRKLWLAQSDTPCALYLYQVLSITSCFLHSSGNLSPAAVKKLPWTQWLKKIQVSNKCWRRWEKGGTSMLLVECTVQPL